MGFNAPSKIQVKFRILNFMNDTNQLAVLYQETALPMLLANPPQNMIAQSQSGTGKTAAFVLAMLSRVDTTKNYVQVCFLFNNL